MEEIDLKELFDYFRSKLIWIVMAIILSVGIGNIFTILTRVPMYRSTTNIVLVSEEKGDSYSTTEQQLNKNLVGTYTEIVKSRRVLNQVIENLKLDVSYESLQRNVSVTSVANTEIIKVSVSNSDSKKAAKIVDEIATIFTKEIQKIYKLNNVTIIDKAQVSSSPYNVNYIKDCVIYLAIGLVASCAVIFIFFYFDTTIKTSEEIENKLKLNVLGMVPKVGKE